MPPDPIAELGARAKAASRVLATTSTEVKDAALLAAADLLLDRHAEILAANADDVAAAEADGQAATVVDRLRLSDMRLLAMANGLRAVAALPDPVGEVADGWTRPNGLRVQRVRVPLGVVAIIYENRPNVTSDAFGLCLKAGNAAFLRGSSGAIRSNIAIAAALREGLAKAGLPARLARAGGGHPPRGGRRVHAPPRVDRRADPPGRAVADPVDPRQRHRALRDRRRRQLPRLRRRQPPTSPWPPRIVENAKTQRPSVCNAAETLLVHRNVAATFLSEVAPRLEGVELVGDEATQEILGDRVTAIATDDDYATEFLDLKLAVRVVDTLDAAIAHITRYGSGHSEAIVTNDLRAADRFVNEVDAAAVLVNASTRFVDGEELGFGAEIGISTQKLHARGPMGLRELTTPEVRHPRRRPDPRLRQPLRRSEPIDRAVKSARRLRRWPTPSYRFESVPAVREALHKVDYLSDEGIAGIVYLADRLGKPILVEGPAGTGKTQLAKSVAEMSGARLIRLQCYEGLDESKALFEWNYKKQLLRIQAERGDGKTWETVEDDIFSDEFLLTRPLLEAITAEDPVVLLIDEVDRVEVETEALLLEILSDYQVSIPELGTIEAKQIPLVFLTSNNTRELSEALKRRCLFLHIDYPDLEREKEIVLTKVPDITDSLADQVARIVRSIRQLELKKAPSVSETLDWARTLLLLGVEHVDAETAKATINILLKYQSDIAKAVRELDQEHGTIQKAAAGK